MTDGQSKLFHLGDVLSVTTRLLVSPRYLYGVYEIIHYLIDDEPAVDDLQLAITRCRPLLLKQYPELAEVDSTNVDFDHWQLWMDAQKDRFGEWIEVEKPFDESLAP